MYLLTYYYLNTTYWIFKVREPVAFRWETFYTLQDTRGHWGEEVNPLHRSITVSHYHHAHSINIVQGHHPMHRTSITFISL